MSKCLYKSSRVLYGPKKGQFEAYNASSMTKKIALDCGRCHQCKIKRLGKWKARLLMESYTAKEKKWSLYFITLTYDEDSLKKMANFKSLEEVQKMFKRIRKNNKNLKIRYFVVSELGKKLYRLHHHLILWASKDFLKKTSGGKLLYGKYFYQSQYLSWNLGFHSINKLVLDNQASIKKVINYLSKYMIKNVLSYSYSLALGKEYIDAHSIDGGQRYLLNGKIFDSPFYKRFLPYQEVIRLNKLKLENENYSEIKRIVQKDKQLQLWK